MKNMLKNKKGFTLVELLAVVVILALLIVITANTVLPMLDKTKESGMKTYASRVLTNTETHWSADNLTGTQSVPKYYKIKGDITKKSDYIGCVEITGSASSGYTYKLRMYDLKNSLFLTTGTISSHAITDAGISSAQISDQSKFTVVDYAITSGTAYATADIDTLEGLCTNETNFAKYKDNLSK